MKFVEITANEKALFCSMHKLLSDWGGKRAQEANLHIVVNIFKKVMQGFIDREVGD